ncbi:MAG: non-canonical purine NTP pyrophosphatase [Nanoarchaeota archaeon]|nr:non-canonical purine NTP pyrophosphatase [Nanoarchaeota archaeon]MBU1621976.1 non-canonical purine NTP pyrophosphatase [Nanoarchaeota archaeon]MBU1974123.1 non-canonical purine NTP pyrophosphatase [Nanoarchaeota archaeon]
MIYFITGNVGKLREVQAVIPGVEGIELNLPEIQDSDAQKVIAEKIEAAARNNPGNFFVEDVSVHLDCLNGFPGPLIKWFLKSLGNQGIYELVNKHHNDTVVVKSAIGYYDGKEAHFFVGEIKGKVVSPRGESSFGWDPIFQPEGYEKTFAEMTLEEKNEISHRKMALMKFKEFLEKHG